VTGATAYKVYRCLDTNSDSDSATFCTPTTIVGATNTLFYNGALVSLSDTEQPGVGNRWCYAVLATNGTDSSALTTTLVTHCGTVQPVLAPDIPTNSATNTPNSKTPTITWSAPTAGGTPTGYKVFRCETTAINDTCSPDLAGTAVSDKLSPLSFTQSTAPATDRKFCYRITAYNTGGTSGGSGLVCGLDNLTCTVNFTLSAGGNGTQRNLSWSSSGCGTSPTYTLYKCNTTSTGCTPTTADSSYTNTTTTSITNYSIGNNNTCFKVVASSTNSSIYCATKNGTTSYSYP
jgi:hypothetical protein